MMFDEEEYRRKKGGSVNVDDERLMRRFFANSGKPSSVRTRSQQAARIRFHNYKFHVGDGGKPEAVFKVISGLKQASAVTRLVKYVEREDENKIELFDQFGLPRDKKEIEKWDLLPDSENEKEKGRRQYIQAWHLTCSIKREDDKDSNEILAKLETAVREFVASEFAAHFFQVLWGIHDDTENHHHAHIIVKAKPDRGNRLHFDRAGEMIDILRNSFAEKLRSAGLDYVATRREDRHSVRRAIVEGQDVLRPEFPAGGYRVDGPVLLHLATIAEPRKKRWEPFKKTEKINVHPLFENIYQKPEAAFQNWIWLLEHPALKKRRYQAHRFGLWLIVNRPEFLGEIRDMSGKPNSIDEVIRIFENFELPAWPQHWLPQLQRKYRKPDDKEKMLAEIRKIVRDEIESNEITKIEGTIEGTVQFLAVEYKNMKAKANLSDTAKRAELLANLKTYSHKFYTDVIGTLKQEKYAIRGLKTFAIGSAIHLLITQEMAMIDPDEMNPNDSGYLLTLRANAKTYRSHLETYFSKAINNRKAQIEVFSDTFVDCLGGATCVTKYTYSWVDKKTGKKVKGFSGSKKPDRSASQNAHISMEKYRKKIITQLTKDLGNPKISAIPSLKVIENFSFA